MAFTTFLRCFSRTAAPLPTSTHWRRFCARGLGALQPVAALLLVDVSLSIVWADEILRKRIDELRAMRNPAVQGVSLASVRLLDDFYRQRSDAYAWNDADQVDDLATLARNSAAEGLDPEDFHLSASLAAAGDDPARLSAEQRVDAEILLSDSLLRLIHNQRYGKVDPRALERSWNYNDGPSAADLVSEFQSILGDSDLARGVESLLQRPNYYARLVVGLAHYRKLAATGGWPSVPSGRKLELGMRDNRIPLIRERLRITGDYAGGNPPAPRSYDADLETAVRAFQERHSLTVDGVVGPATLGALNVSAERRVDQIRVNLERMRWVSDDLPQDYLLVDIATQKVTLFRERQPVWESRAIVGKEERPTPSFRDHIEYLEFNPTWTAPPTIVREDILPKARTNPEAVTAKGLEVINRNGQVVDPLSVNWHVSANSLPYTLRQPPGPKNAMGQVKFVFPNRHSVYLHDTPKRHLFKHPKRTFSSGCVRVDRPLELAELLLNDPRWDQDRFNQILESQRPASVRLRKPLPVVLSYWTAEADDQGRVHFRPDIYQRDTAVLFALNRPAGTRVVNTDGSSPIATTALAPMPTPSKRHRKPPLPPPAVAAASDSERKPELPRI